MVTLLGQMDALQAQVARTYPPGQEPEPEGVQEQEDGMPLNEMEDGDNE